MLQHQIYNIFVLDVEALVSVQVRTKVAQVNRYDLDRIRVIPVNRVYFKQQVGILDRHFMPILSVGCQNPQKLLDRATIMQVFSVVLP